MNKQCCCSEKSTQRTDDEKQKLINRLSRIEGQVRGLKKMIENDSYCPDIMIQSSAVSSALNSFDKELLQKHMHTCVLRDINNGKEDEAIEELSTLIAKLMK